MATFRVGSGEYTVSGTVGAVPTNLRRPDGAKVSIRSPKGTFHGVKTDSGTLLAGIIAVTVLTGAVAEGKRLAPKGGGPGGC